MIKERHNTALGLAEKVRASLSECRLCPRRCGVNRLKGEVGYCGLNDKVYCFREMLHRFEESLINPSHQIYLAGCNLRCEFCSVSEWNAEPKAAMEMDAERIALKITERKEQGARSVNFLGGEPVLSLHGIFDVLARVKVDTKVVLNSNVYFSTELFETLDGFVDIYLADLKCGNNQCAVNMLNANNYIEIVQENISAAARSDLILRHLVLPGHFECCSKPVLDWIAENHQDIKVSLRGDYAPPVKAEKTPNKYLDKSEYEQVVIYARELELNLIQ